MSLSQKLRSKIEDLKTPGPTTATNRRLNQITDIILRKDLSREQKDQMLRQLVSDSMIEKALKMRGVKV